MCVCVLQCLPARERASERKEGEADRYGNSSVICCYGSASPLLQWALLCGKSWTYENCLHIFYYLSHSNIYFHFPHHPALAITMYHDVVIVVVWMSKAHYQGQKPSNADSSVILVLSLRARIKFHHSCLIHAEMRYFIFIAHAAIYLSEILIQLCIITASVGFFGCCMKNNSLGSMEMPRTEGDFRILTSILI